MNRNDRVFVALLVMSFYIAVLEFACGLAQDYVPNWFHYVLASLIIFPGVVTLIVRSVRSIQKYNEGD